MSDRNSKIGLALALAAAIHKNQTDWYGNPYLDHIIEVRRRVIDWYFKVHLTTDAAVYDREELEVFQIVAILHDAVEDFEGKQPHERGALLNQIKRSFGTDVSEAVNAITLRDGEKDGNKYLEVYIERVARNYVARIVKMCDLSHNLEAFRLPPRQIRQKDFDRWEKYHKAFVRLAKEE